MNLSSHSWLIPSALVLLGLAGSAIAAALLSLLVLKGGPVDRPRERGAHTVPTPTSGGLAIMAACGVVCAIILWFAGDAIPGQWRDGALLFGFASLMGLSGALDDLIDMPPTLRLGFQVGLCLLFAWLFHVDTLTFGPGLVVRLDPFTSTLGCALWLVLGINTINFMDGANGLASGTQTLALLVLAGLIMLLAPVVPLGSDLGVILLICACAAGANLGFLPFNLAGKAFQGDAGALFGGALITGTSLVVKAYGVGSVWFGGFLLAPLIVDVVLTLITRLRQGKDVMRPHKEHLYQLWLQRRDSSHIRLSVRIWALCAISSGVGLVARAIDLVYQTDIRFVCLAAVILLYSLMWGRVRRELLQSDPISTPSPVRITAPEAP
ncbi:glycosyl transferase family 4 family protein [Asticcacaulis biprosthecium C19]|uniref:Glycosyl transferase family 4 family protein n=1 Tax=Asticcacaulis biprosthecium C19 TaxID=715226 RepID=F4QL40_9CAUL|nr:glycosyl transferase family 4 family protein [Asticcacaulis biprosthecium]EGF93415.1 glycosyl transferase family 4 family protein [Asticcacaulis biprosthecium C19]